ncbi:uncharacterized protein N7477_000906 [Penicillium maclennaniae]|uniref:uncharacterized protein n=1 Tax=Penicillium maclennaniae TaxID=1343394 RepID=UPI00254195AB|nr:uncharacterized protein N7477_000906 [Penicillium maclennaniae]KAJ5684561.1 hypothetical protein N7477_000906 [Penicillium maclennaniae]
MESFGKSHECHHRNVLLLVFSPSKSGLIPIKQENCLTYRSRYLEQLQLRYSNPNYHIYYVTFLVSQHVEPDSSSKPVTSIVRRGRESRCWYHPSPMTKRSSQRSTLQKHLSSSVEQGIGSTTNVGFSETTSVAAPEFHSWPFMIDSNGPASSASTLEALDDKTRDEYLTALRDIISALRFLPAIEKHIRAYFSFSQGALVQRPIILELAKLVRRSLEESGRITEETEDSIHFQMNDRFACDMLRCSSSEVVISPSLDLEQFCALFWGENVHVETLGLLFAVAARSHLHRYSDEERDDYFIREMSRCSKLSLRLARDLAPQATDLMIWLAHEDLQLTTTIEGDASLSVWRRMSDLATDLFALGLNRESTYSPDFIPFFLAEARRRMFSKVYYLDKLFAMVFHRPPRIAARHADCKPPLDLSDDELFPDSPGILDRTRKSLTHDGWNTDGRYRPTTWARVRYILGQFREEIVEYQIQPRRSTDHTKIRDLAIRCNEAWNALPRTHDTTKRIGRQIFQWRILCDCTSTTSSELLIVSGDMLETIIQVANPRGRASYFPRDLPSILLIYGLPSASMLVSALETTKLHLNNILPPSMKSSTLLRNLSVLVSHLENVCRHGDTNHTFCIQASKAISRKLDIILSEPQKPASSIPFNASQGFNTPSQSLVTPGMPSEISPGAGELGLLDMKDLDSFDLANWVIDVDLDTFGSSWDIT